jgi:hypothetical protein
MVKVRWPSYHVTHPLLVTHFCNFLLKNLFTRAVPWLRRLVAGLSPRRPGLDPGLMWDLWWTKWHWDRFFPRVLRVSPVNLIPPVLHYLEKRKNLIIFLFIFSTGLHNKPQGCGASVGSAAGPFSEEKKFFTQLSKCGGDPWCCRNIHPRVVRCSGSN